jgi:hypothetical protein
LADGQYVQVISASEVLLYYTHQNPDKLRITLRVTLDKKVAEVLNYCRPILPDQCERPTWPSPPPFYSTLQLRQPGAPQPPRGPHVFTPPVLMRPCRGFSRSKYLRAPAVAFPAATNAWGTRIESGARYSAVHSFVMIYGELRNRFDRPCKPNLTARASHFHPAPLALVRLRAAS